MRLRNPVARARGIGSAQDGAHEWWVQRLLSIALLVLTPWLLWLVVSLLGADVDGVRASIAQPWNAALLLAFVIATFWHVQLGLKVVIEDYIHTRWLEVVLQIAVRFACVIAVIVAAIAIGRIAFTA